MPSVFSTLFTSDNRCYLYGAIISVTAIGIIHFKRASGRNKLQTFSQKSTVNTIDLITTEIPLFIAPFAVIDSVHYATEIAYRILKSSNITRRLMIQCAVSGTLGFVLPISFMFRNKGVAGKILKIRGLRGGMRRFLNHLVSMTISLGVFGSTSRLMIASTKYIVTAPIAGVTMFAVIQSWTHRQMAVTLLPLGIGFGIIGRDVFNKMKQWEQCKMDRIYTRIADRINQITDHFVWKEMEWKYLIFGGFLMANFINFLIDSVMSYYFIPFSFKIKDRLMQQDNKWIYDSYYQSVKNANTGLPKDIMYEIFQFAGIEEEYRAMMANDRCRIQYEEKHYVVQEVSILAHIAFSCWSYSELHLRIKHLK